MTDLALTFPLTTHALLAAGPDRTLSGLAVPLGVPSGPSADGHRYQFDGPPDNAQELIDVVHQHDEDAVVGRLAEPWTQDPAGLNAVARVFATTRGNDVLVEAAEGARAAFSVGAVIAKFTTRPDGVRVVNQWTARHLGVVRHPAFEQTRGITVKASATPSPPEGHPVTDIRVNAEDIDLGALETKILDLPNVAALAAKINNLPTEAELAAKIAEQLKLSTPPAHPLAAFSSAADFYGEFQAAILAGDSEKADTLQAAFAVPDQTTGDNPGLMPPAWRTDIKKRIDRRTPAMRLFGTIGLPDTGMDVTWPYLDPTLNIDDIVKQQINEKDELQGVKIKILKDTLGIKSAGAVSDISYQLLLRGSPSYMAVHNEILLAAWSRYLEAKFEAQLLAKGTLVEGAAPATAKDLKTTLFAKSANVEDAVGSPADIALVSTDLWTAYGALDLPNARYGTQNVEGTSDARTLRVEVNGFTIERAPFFPPGTLMVASSDAAKASNSGAKIATQEEVRRLGRDVAVWGMYTDGEVYFPHGIQIVKPAA